MKKRKRQAADQVNHERWLISYADFITLLFAFFVVLYASSRVDQHRVVEMASALRTAFQELGLFTPQSRNVNLQPDQTAYPGRKAALRGAVGLSEGVADPASLVALKHQLSTMLAPEIAKHEIGLRFGRGGLIISLEELGFFDSGSAKLRPGSEATLNRIALSLRPLQNDISIEGHTDNIPIHNGQYASNWDLSAARAVEIVRLFITQYQFPPERLSAAGYSEYHPIAANSTPQGRQLNRRVDVVVKARFPNKVVDTAPVLPPGVSPPPERK